MPVSHQYSPGNAATLEGKPWYSPLRLSSSRRYYPKKLNQQWQSPWLQELSLNRRGECALEAHRQGLCLLVPRRRQGHSRLGTYEQMLSRWRHWRGLRCYQAHVGLNTRNHQLLLLQASCRSNGLGNSN